MEAELVALAGSGATTMVGLMATDLWTQTRDRVARLFARGSDTGTLTEELEASRSELATAVAAGDQDTATDVESEWRSRLRRLLQADPEAAAELRALLEEVRPLLAPSQGQVVSNAINGGVQHGPVIQGHTFQGGLTFHSTPGAGTA